MKILKMSLAFCVSVLFAVLAVPGFSVSAEESIGPETAANLKEMPLLKGDVWQKMTQDEKVAFVWGMGHVATMERAAVDQYPELKQESFAAKLCLGIAGMPMNRIVNAVDTYYKENPGQTADPVIKVIWDKLVQPKLTAGSATLPVK